MSLFESNFFKLISKPSTFVRSNIFINPCWKNITVQYYLFLVIIIILTVSLNGKQEEGNYYILDE